MKQTAVEWLFEKLPTIDKYDPYYSDIIEKAKAIERQQIINAYDSGAFYLEGGLYYKETFETETECDFNYYDIRAGKCQHAKVVHGKIVCSVKGCN